MEDFVFEAWNVWLIVSVFCFIAEMFVPGFYLAIFGIGAFASFMTAYYGEFNLLIQVLVFVVVSIVFWFFFRPIVLRYLTKSSENKTSNVDAMIGRKCKVISAISADEPGRVKLGSELWTALLEEGAEPVGEGETVEVVQVEGAKLLVKKHS
ncbi:NfeD family protein [bacterium]|nr:NfeD family protein [bacterium]